MPRTRNKDHINFFLLLNHDITLNLKKGPGMSGDRKKKASKPCPEGSKPDDVIFP